MQTSFDEILVQLKNNDPELTYLNLSDRGLNAADAKSLASALENNIGLRKLDLGNSGISATGAICLDNALKNNTKLCDLSLALNKIGDRDS